MAWAGAALALIVALTFAMCFFALNKTAAEAQRLTVVIDAGHGGIDGGVVGRVTGTKESEINLAIARLLQERFEDAGFRVVMTRQTEAGLYGAATSGYKRRDMQKRAEIIDKSNPAMVLSVHQNYFPVAARRGGQVFFRADSAPSHTLACMIQSALNEMPESVRASQPLAGDYYILNCSDYPSVIVECGFLSNEEDEALLLSQDYREAIADAVCRGALGFLSSSAGA